MKLSLYPVMFRISIVGVVVLLLLSLVSFIHPSFAQDASNLDQKKKEIEELQAKLVEIQGQKQTLAKTISYINTKIQLPKNKWRVLKQKLEN